MTKLKPSGNEAGFGHGGVEYPLVNGVIDIPEHAVATALIHGYLHLTKEELQAIEEPEVVTVKPIDNPIENARNKLRARQTK